jgi:hypothetical protein
LLTAFSYFLVMDIEHSYVDSSYTGNEPYKIIESQRNAPSFDFLKTVKISGGLRWAFYFCLDKIEAQEILTSGFSRAKNCALPWLVEPANGVYLCNNIDLLQQFMQSFGVKEFFVVSALVSGMQSECISLIIVYFPFN